MVKETQADYARSSLSGRPNGLRTEEASERVSVAMGGRSRETRSSGGMMFNRQSFDAVDDIDREEEVLIREGFNSATLLQPTVTHQRHLQTAAASHGGPRVPLLNACSQ